MTRPDRSTSPPPKPRCTRRATSSTARCRPAQPTTWSRPSSKDPSTPSPSTSPPAAPTSASPRSAPRSPRNTPTTSLTAEHAHHLATFTQAPIIATDADPAGLHAAERAYWHLTPHRLAPRYARWAAGADPAATLHQHGPARVAATLTHAIDLAEHLINQRHDILPAAQADRASLPVLAAADPTWWDRVPAGLLSDFATLVEAWDRDPRAAADHQLANANRIKKQIDNWHQLTPEQRWTPLLTHVDHRVIDTPAWPAIATRLDALHTQGIDVHHAAAAAAAPFKNHSPRAAADGIRAELGQLIESHTEPTPARTRTAHTESSSLAHRPPSPIR